MKTRVFKGTMISWRELFDDAARFATELGPTRVRRVSHSANNSRGIVVVWYDDVKPASEAPESRLRFVMRCDFEKGTLISWEELFQKVADRAAKLAPEQLVSLSHSDDQGSGIAAVWYWTAYEPEVAAPADS
jgi:hypothetical protein